MNFSFGEVLARAGQITWKHKNLWLVGIVISLIGLLPALITLPFSSSFFSFTDPSEMNRQMPVILLVNALTIFISLLLIPVYVIGMTVPALGTLQLERGGETLNLGELIKGTLPYFWRILGVLVLIWVGMFVVMIGLMICDVAVSAITLGIGSLCLFPVFIPLVLLVLAMTEQGTAAVLVDNLGVSEALQRAWDLIKKNVGVMALLSIIIYLGYMIVATIISVPMMIPMFGFMTNMTQSMNSPSDIQSFETTFRSMFRSMMLWMLVFSPLYAVVQGIFLTFLQSAWTLTYLRLTRSSQLQPLPQGAAS